MEREYLSKSSGPILENCNQYNYEDSIVEYRNFSLTKIEDNVAMMLDEFYGNIHEILHQIQSKAFDIPNRNNPTNKIENGIHN